MNEKDILNQLEDEANEEVRRTEGEIRSLLHHQQKDAEQLLERLGEGYAPWSNVLPAATLETETAKHKAWKTVLHRIQQLRHLAAVKNAQAS